MSSVYAPPISSNCAYNVSLKSDNNSNTSSITYSVFVYNKTKFSFVISKLVTKRASDKSRLNYNNFMID